MRIRPEKPGKHGLQANPTDGIERHAAGLNSAAVCGG
jgi:hypothetical protein